MSMRKNKEIKLDEKLIKFYMKFINILDKEN